MKTSSIVKIILLVMICALALAASVLFGWGLLELVKLNPIISGGVAFIPLVFAAISLKKRPSLTLEQIMANPTLILTHWKYFIRIPAALILGIIVCNGMWAAVMRIITSVIQNWGWIVLAGILIYFLAQIALRFKSAAGVSDSSPDWDVVNYNLHLIRSVLFRALKNIPSALGLCILTNVEMVTSSIKAKYNSGKGWIFTYMVPLATLGTALDYKAIMQFVSSRIKEILLSGTPCELPQNTVFMDGLTQPILKVDSVSPSDDGVHAMFVIQYYNEFLSSNASNYTGATQRNLTDDEI